MPEWLIGPVLKTVEPARVPWVRIPPLPPFKPPAKVVFCCIGFHLYVCNLSWTFECAFFAAQSKLQKVSTKTVKLKQVITKRKLLVNQRNQITNNLKSTFNQLGIILPFKNLTTIKAYKWLQNNEDICIQQFEKILQTEY